jgi:putative colanic acid biosysnthesis UDP-glucose lipid carrier transferase
MSSSFPQLNQGSQSFSSLVKHSIEPVVSAGTMFAVAYFNDEVIDYHYSILALLILLITFPGEWPTSTPAHFARQIGTSWAIQSILLVLLGIGTGTLSMFPTRVILLWIVLMPVAVFATCLLLKKFVWRIKLLRVGKNKAVIVGGTTLAEKLLLAIKSDNMSPIDIVGIFDDRDPPRLDLTGYAPVLGKITGVADYCKSQGIKNIYITLPMSSHPRILRLLDELNDTTASIYFLPDIFIHELIQARVDMLNGIPILAICETPFLGINGLIKRVSDIILSSLILILISPLMLAIAIWVKRTSPGPVLFRQRRYGLDGKEIVVYKFRSMTVSEDGSDVPQAKKNDVRVTPFGAFIRRTSLDELPQFFNVLQGSMSIVGPRPHAIAHNETYRKLIKSYMVRHKVKPGITGWAQVNGFRGETETLEKMQKRIEYDLDYLRNWSIYLDLWIIIRTIVLVLKDRNAY